jgi:magnesium transporter
MNFKNMPELELPYGYHTVISMIFLLCGTLYWRFKRAKWL